MNCPTTNAALVRNKCISNFKIYYKTIEKTGYIADSVGLACILTARNGAKGATIARICADVVG